MPRKNAAPTGDGVSVVVVSHNSRSDLARCLPAVVERDRQVLVVDNASVDDTPAFVRERFPTVEVVPLPENVGFGAACNAGFERAVGDFVLLLNPDAWPTEGGIERLAACAEREPRVGAVGPALYTPDGALHASLVGFPTRWWLGRPAITSRRGRRQRRVGRRLTPKDRRFLVGAALLVRRDAYEDVGGFDPRFFMFSEDVDLCWRLHEAGWRLSLCSEAAFVHLGGTTTTRNWPEMYREQLSGHLRFLAKHRGTADAEFARRLLGIAVRVRALLASDPDRQAFREAARWLASGNAESLLSR